MNTYFIKVFFTFLILFSGTCISQSWQWASQIKNTCLNGPLDLYSLMTDGADTYGLGAFSDCITIDQDTLICNGRNDMFLVKYDAIGNVIWDKRIGGDATDISTNEFAFGVIDTINQCIYIAGNFSGAMQLSPTITIHGALIGSSTFLAKIDLNGDFVWARVIGDNFDNDIFPFLQPDGRILTSGYAWDTTYVDSQMILQGNFIARFDTAGNCLWAKTIIEPAIPAYISASFIEDDIILAGIFNSSSLTIDTISMICKGGYDGYVARLDSLGHVKWVQHFGASGNDRTGNVYVDQSDNIYLGGTFTDSLVFDTITLVNNGSDLFLAKFNAFGNIYWLKQGHSTGADNFILDLTALPNSEIAVSGWFSGSVSLDNQNMSTAFDSDMFLAKFDANGICVGVDHFGEGKGFNLVKDNSDVLICSGVFSGTVNLGNTSLNSIGGYEDIFIAKHNTLTEISDPVERHSNSLLIYANPNQGSCTIQIPNEFRNEKYLTLKVYGQKGELLKFIQFELNSEVITLNMEPKATGVYTAILSNGKKQFSGKIVFEE